MPSKGRYTAGKQVSRYEADSENIDIEYKNLEGQGHTGWCSNCSCPLGDKKPWVIKGLTITVVFGLGLVIGFLFRKTVYNPTNGDMPTVETTNTSNIYSIKQVKIFFYNFIMKLPNRYVVTDDVTPIFIATKGVF